MATVSPSDEGSIIPTRSNSDAGAISMVHAHACVTCAQRKVKCDRLSPCSNCEKANVECEYRDPAPPKRRKRKQVADDDTLAKLERYEKILASLGVDMDTPSSSVGHTRSPSGQAERSSKTGSTFPSRRVILAGSDLKKYSASGKSGTGERIIIDGNRSRYVENNLWSSLSEDVPPSKEENWYDSQSKLLTKPIQQRLRDRGPASLLFGNNQCLSEDDICNLHPPLAYRTRMWYIFRENVDPLTKLFDINVKEQMFLKTAGEQTEEQYRYSEAFFFSVYFAAITTLDERECLTEFGEPRAELLDRYQLGTEQSLINNNLLVTSDMFVLQAFLLYLICMKTRADAGTLWPLAGVLIRMAQRGGLHRDADKIDGDTWPWNAELRRRAWYQIIMFDGRLSELSGLGVSAWSSFKWDTKQPLNLNDSDLDPSATELPSERPGATDMLFVSMVYEIGQGFRSLLNPFASPCTFPDVPSKLKAVDEIEQSMGDKYLRYCDPLVPLHQMSLIMARASISSMRFKVNHPYQRSHKSQSDTEEGKVQSFGIALKCIEYHNLALSTQSIRKFHWYIRLTLPWAQLVYLMSELKYRITGNDTDRAWDQIQEVFVHHPEILQDKTKALHVAFGDFALRAWDSRCNEFERRFPGASRPENPSFIQTLLKARSESKRNASDSQLQMLRNAATAQVDDKSGIPNGGAQSQASTVTMEQEIPLQPMNHQLGFNVDPSLPNWPEWDDLMFHDPTLHFNFPMNTIDGPTGYHGYNP